MKGYPKTIATKQDYLNLLPVPEFRDRAEADLVTIYNADDAYAMRVVSGSEETGDLVTEQIENPMPLWKAKGFTSREEILEVLNG
jgi:hypothetical protein